MKCAQPRFPSDAQYPSCRSRRFAPITFAACLDAPTDVSSTDEAVTGDNDAHGAPEHLFHGRGDAGKGGGGGSSPLMTNHGGQVLSTNTTFAIFWGSSWASDTSDKMAGVATFLSGFGGSAYASASTEYKGANGTQFTGSSTYLGQTIDSTAAPKSALTTSSAVAEACKIIKGQGKTADPNGLYLIYTDVAQPHVSYCAWHSWGTCPDGSPIQVAYFPKLDGQLDCDPIAHDSTGTAIVNGHSEALTALTNVTGHELSETITDPHVDAWYDAAGQENGDKCAWRFSPNQPTTFSNGSTWLVQGEWSNAAYTAGTGYPNVSGQKGCLPNPPPPPPNGV